MIFSFSSFSGHPIRINDIHIIGIDIIIQWAQKVFSSVENHLIGYLYVQRHENGAILNVYTQTINEKWMKTTRSLDENELPNEIRILPKDDKQHRIADFG